MHQDVKQPIIGFISTIKSLPEFLGGSTGFNTNSVYHPETGETICFGNGGMERSGFTAQILLREFNEETYLLTTHLLRADGARFACDVIAGPPGSGVGCSRNVRARFIQLGESPVTLYRDYHELGELLADVASRLAGRDVQMADGYTLRIELVTHNVVTRPPDQEEAVWYDGDDKMVLDAVRAIREPMYANGLPSAPPTGTPVWVLIEVYTAGSTVGTTESEHEERGWFRSRKSAESARDIRPKTDGFFEHHDGWKIVQVLVEDCPIPPVGFSDQESLI